MFLSQFVKAELAFSHGSADVERYFLLSEILLLSERASVPEKVLNAKLVCDSRIEHMEAKQKGFQFQKNFDCG